jgi:NAD-dependent DNA ligase
VKTYILKDVVPAWHLDPATLRQLKVLHFFGKDTDQPLTKGAASGVIGRIFSDPANKHLWAAYVYTTGDEDHESADLCPHDKLELARAVIPVDWRPKRSSISCKDKEAFEGLVADILKDGSPFDDPLPNISVADSVFCFTGKFSFGSRSECRQAVVAKGGAFTDNVTSKTDVLVIGRDANPTWANDSYGNKIEAAMMLRIQRGKPHIIPETYWERLLEL